MPARRDRSFACALLLINPCLPARLPLHEHTHPQPDGDQTVAAALRETYEQLFVDYKVGACSPGQWVSQGEGGGHLGAAGVCHVLML